jgi:ATPase subunit of ABC transporter with duplicated ATPase domains
MALQTVASLSGGQKSRVAFARMCMGNPNFLVLDEPTNHLDIETIEALGKAINRYTVSILNALTFISLGSDGSKIMRKFIKLEVISV